MDRYRSISHFGNRRAWLAATACAAWPWPVIAAQRVLWPRQRETPVLELPGLNGAVWSLAAAKGRPVLLNFWASWCEPCRAEMPSLEHLAKRHEAQGLQVMAVNYREGEAAVRRFVETTALNLPVVRDIDGKGASSFGVHVFPSTVAFSRQGKALFIVTGELDWESPLAEEWMAALL
jgi:thiol-disulfide isomerase/thioredoxin